MAESNLENKLEKFCSTQDTKFLNNIDEITKLLLIDTSYSCLYQKYGNIQLANKVLEYYGEIQNILDVPIYNSQKPLNMYQKLKRTGVTTLPVFSSEELIPLQKEFHQTLLSFPEYSRHTTEPIYVLGGFAAFGNPASFHNPLVRKIRLKCREEIIKLFKIDAKAQPGGDVYGPHGQYFVILHIDLYVDHTRLYALAY